MTMVRSLIAFVLVFAIPAAQGTTRLMMPSFKESHKVVAVAPVFVEPFGVSEEQTAAIDRLLEERLRKMGFTVVGTEEFGPIWKAKAIEIGGYYDPYSGERIEEKYLQVRDHTYRALAERHQIDAYIFPTVVVSEAEMRGSRARWHGVSQKVPGPGFLAAMGSTSVTTRAVTALSLSIEARDENDNPLFNGVGGLHLLHRYTKSGAETMSVADMFRDQKRNRKAVTVATAKMPYRQEVKR